VTGPTEVSELVDAGGRRLPSLRKFAARILHPEGFGVLDDGPGRREAAGCHRLGAGRYGFQFIGVTSNSVPLVEFTQPAAVSLHG
jgi:hypothetical protein